MTVSCANLDTAGEKVGFDHGQLSIVTLDGTALVRAVFNPGWKWSRDVQPRAGTPSCQSAHAGVVLSGRFCIRMDDGTELELGPGDAHVVPPGHDAWVVGDEQCVIIDIGPAPDAATSAPDEVVRTYFDRFNRADVEGIIGQFTEDATVMADGAPTAAGHAQLRATYGEFFAAFAVTEDLAIDRVEHDQHLAVVRAHSSGVRTTKATGESSPLALREMFSLRLTTNGWRISDYAFNREPSH